MEWYENSEEGVGFLQGNLASNNIILYAYYSDSHPVVSIDSVLVPNSKKNKFDAESLRNVRIDTAESWKIIKSYNENVISDLSLNPPLSDTIIGDGEQLVFKRNFSYVKEYQPKIEINQKLIHSLDLYFMEDYHSYCKLSEGKIEKVITIYENKRSDNHKNSCAVTILKSALEYYMALCEMSLVTRFNFHRQHILGIPFEGNQLKTREIKEPYLYYKSEINPAQSYTYGCQIHHTNLTKVDLINKTEEEEGSVDKKYATFITHDWKNNQIIMTSCDPKFTANYFTESDLPFEISPAFFSPEVLVKYTKDSERYKITDRSISCRGYWQLKPYGINDEGQVFTYLRYLASLPYEEQLYWKHHNEMPKAGISRQALDLDFRGKFSTVDTPQQKLRKLVMQLNQVPPFWWKPCENEQINSVLVPVDDTPEQWGYMILELNKVIVEGLNIRGLRIEIKSKGTKYDDNWGSVRLLEFALKLNGKTPEEAFRLVSPLREINDLRSKKGIAHRNPKEKKEAIKEARRNNFGSLTNHFNDLIQRVHCSMKVIFEFLSLNNE